MARWVATADEVGRTYYYDQHSRQTRWELPDDGEMDKGDASTLCHMLRETQAEVGDHVRIHIASKVRTCLRIGLDHALRGAFGEWRCAAVPQDAEDVRPDGRSHPPPTHRFVLPMARAISVWMIQRDRTVAAIAGTMLLQDCRGSQASYRGARERRACTGRVRAPLVEREIIEPVTHYPNASSDEYMRRRSPSPSAYSA